MDRADGAYVPLMELQEKAGAFIATMVNVPAAYITSGAGSALMLATAAAMAGDDDDKIQQLPDTSGMKNEILIQTRQRYWYDRCLELAGARLVMFGSEERTTETDLENAIGPNTAAVHYYAVEQSHDPDALSLEQTIAIGHAHGVLVTVDAAGQIYPLENFGKYVRMGADFQCIAAKYMGAPQSTGLALGSPEMIRKIGLQAFASYEGRRVRGVGRPQKVDRQEIDRSGGGGQALDDHEPRRPAGRRRATQPEHIGCFVWYSRAQDRVDRQRDWPSTLRPERVGRPSHRRHDDLRPQRPSEGGRPSIWTRVRDEDDFITLHMFGLNPGEDRIVASGSPHYSGSRVGTHPMRVLRPG